MSNPCFKMYLAFVIAILSINMHFAQTLTGTVTNGNGTLINAKILIKDATKPNTLSEFTITSRGVFNYILKKKYTTSGLLIEVNATGYASIKKLILPEELQNTLEFKFALIKQKIEKLEEVFIKSEKSAFKIKENTVVYNVASYKDGTERKVEDLLKKLPGIEINEANGVIKYKGKAIETVTLEGDNLFDYNYSIGTKNINIDLVEDIEAIENYSENRLLKGIENSDKVILNLKLKENKFDFSFDTDLGFGDFPDSKKNALDASLNVLGISKKQKSFAVATYNNISKNTSPFNYFNNEISLEQIKERVYFSQKIISDFTIPQVTDKNLSNINNQFFKNINSVFNISKKIKTKVNLYYLADKINTNQFYENNFTINNQDFSTFDDNIIEKIPINYRGDLELEYNISKSSLLTYNISIRNESIDTDKTVFSNQNNAFKSVLKSNSVFLKQDIEYTKKLSKSSAIQYSITSATNNLKQKLYLQPSIFNNAEFNEDVQNNNSKNNNFELKAILLGKGKKNSKYNFSLGYNLNNEFFNSILFSVNAIETETIDNGNNIVNYTKKDIYTTGSYLWRLGKFSIAPNYSFRYLKQDLKQNNLLNNLNLFIFEPSLNLMYTIDRTSYLNFNSGFNKTTQSINNLFPNQVLIDNRLVINNLPDITPRQNETYRFSYSKNDLFNQLNLSLSTGYIKQKGNFFANTVINENTTRITNFFLPERTETIDFNLSVSKLIPFVKTNVKINSNYSIFNYKNIINNSGLRNNKSLISNNSVFFNTAFNSSINFENKTTFTLQENRSINTFVNKSIENEYKVIFTPTKTIFATMTYHYFMPSFTNKSNNYSFLGSKIIYKPNNKNWQIDVSGINLLNEKYYIEENTSDISRNLFRTNLLERYFLLNFTYSF